MADTTSGRFGTRSDRLGIDHSVRVTFMSPCG